MFSLLGFVVVAVLLATATTLMVNARMGLPLLDKFVGKVASLAFILLLIGLLVNILTPIALIRLGG